MRDSEQWIRDQAVEAAYALRSKTLLRGGAGSKASYEIQTGPRRAPLFLFDDGGLELDGPIPMALSRAEIAGLDHLTGIVRFSGINENGLPASLEIRSTNPAFPD